MECPICVNTYTKVRRKSVKCPSCEYTCCAECCRTFILSTVKTPHCMECKKLWSRFFLVDEFGSSFVKNEYSEYRKNVLFDLEKAMFFETQSFVEQKKKTIEYEQKIEQNKREISNIRKRWIPLSNSWELEDRIQSGELLKQQYGLQIDNDIMSWTIAHIGISSLDNNSRERREFIKQCPRDGCTGYLSTQWKCRLCEKFSCARCHEAKDENHVCNEDSVKSVEFFKMDSKPCPRCGVSIHKTEGCDQMYCTSCHTAWSWRTSRIETGRIHNPYYYMYMNERGLNTREIADIQCGGLPDGRTLYSFCTRVGLHFKDIGEFNRSLTDFQEIDLRRYPTYEGTDFDKNKSSRVLFLLGIIDESKFKHEILKRDKGISKCLEYSMVGYTCIQIMTDIFTRILAEKKGFDFSKYSMEFQEACNYVNTLYKEISIAYDCVTPFFSYPDGYVKKTKQELLRV